MLSVYRWSIKNATKTVTLTQKKNPHIFKSHWNCFIFMHGHAYCREGTWQGIDIDRYWWSTKACENMNIPFYSLNHFSYFTVARPLLVLMMVAYVYDGYNLFEYAWIYECRMQYSSKPRVMKNVNAANFERILLLLLLLFVDFFPNFLVDFCHLFALNCSPPPL